MKPAHSAGPSLLTLPTGILESVMIAAADDDAGIVASLATTCKFLFVMVCITTAQHLRRSILRVSFDDLWSILSPRVLVPVRSLNAMIACLHRLTRAFDTDYVSPRRHWGPFLRVDAPSPQEDDAEPDDSDGEWAMDVPPARELLPDWSWLGAARIVAGSCPIKRYAERPAIHLEGEIGGAGWVEEAAAVGFDDQDVRRVHGTVSMLSDGSIRWSLTSMNEDGTEDQWTSEWTEAEHAEGDPPRSLKSHTASLLDRIQHEVQQTAAHTFEAFASLAWLWPLRGILFSITHPQIILSVRHALLKSLISSAAVFAVLAFFTYLPQMALLAIFTGPLAPLVALVVVGAESLLLLSFFVRPLFLEPALSHVFDATLLARGQGQLVREGKTRASASQQNSVARGVQGALVKPLQVFSKDGILRYVLTLPLNMIPAVGTVLFLLYNGYNGGPGWHARYFQLKGFSKGQRASFVEHRRAEYTAFGMATLLFNFIPLVGLLFSFTNTVGAALWAAELEAQANIIDTQVGGTRSRKNSDASGRGQ
ncbi:hypothetical protein BN946_scf184766.g23 [Trametes cinnabarina]|uniref:Uncharacterized protein n=1 Tax=Pycnoporus cinnabarinus TaxID=5643 RepID=A0A060SBM8_PYCCI|nr:hypothetical protein BN946_scf184766.g23 [Trametes cinnabarina]